MLTAGLFIAAGLLAARVMVRIDCALFDFSATWTERSSDAASIGLLLLSFGSVVYAITVLA